MKSKHIFTHVISFMPTVDVSSLTKFTLLWIFLTAIGTNAIRAQDQTGGESNGYKTAIGLSIGIPQFGIDVKHFVTPHSAIEGVVGDLEAPLVGLDYEYHGHPYTKGGFNWFVGLGGTLFFAQPTFPAISVIGGIDYKLKAPIDFSLDLMPSYFLGGSSFNAVFFPGGALCIRYAFNLK